MNILNTVAYVLSNLKGNKFRAALTISSVVIGVTVVIFFSSVVESINFATLKSIKSLGSQTILLQKYDLEKERFEFNLIKKRPPLLPDDGLAIRKNIYGVKYVAPIRLMVAQTIKFTGEEINNVQVIGTNWEYQYTDNEQVKIGRFLNKNDAQYKNRICILGDEVFVRLFKGRYPLQNEIYISGIPFKVVGVLRKKGMIMGNSMDNKILVPIECFEKFFKTTGTRDEELAFHILYQGSKSIDKVIQDIQILMRIRRGLKYNESNNFGVNTYSWLKVKFRNLTRQAFIFLLFVAAVSLFVAGIGITNTLLISMNERIREIGIRKAVGASNMMIFKEFLCEALLLASIGGIIGILCAQGLFILIALADATIEVIIPFWSIVLGVIFSIGIGIIAGLYPAYKSARINPIEALRYE